MQNNTRDSNEEVEEIFIDVKRFLELTTVSDSFFRLNLLHHPTLAPYISKIGRRYIIEKEPALDAFRELLRNNEFCESGRYRP